MNLVIAASAENDLNDIVDYIARDNPARSISFVAELIAKIETIPSRPLSFPARDEWKAGLRSAPFHSYHIVFKISDDHVEVVRVLHSARDIPAVF